MELRKSRFIRVGSRVGAGVIVGAILAVVPSSPSTATHLTGVTLAGASAPIGTSQVVLNGVINSSSDGTCNDYGWIASSPNGAVSPSSQAPAVSDTAPFTLTVNTSMLPAGSHNVSVTVDWQVGDCVQDLGNTIATATIKITKRNGTFNCSAYAARTQTDYQPANPSFSPCKDDNNYFAQLQPILGLGNVGAVRATTALEPDNPNAVAPKSSDYADAQAHVAGVDLTVAGVRIRTGALWAQASANCTGLGMSPKRATNGTVATVDLNGRSFGTTSGYLKIRILSVTIEINKVTTSGNTTVRQALVITRQSLLGPSLKIVVGEARIGYTGNPCQGQGF